MRSHSRIIGHGGRAGALLRSLGTFVVLVCVTALRPAPAAAQMNFAVARQVGSSIAAASVATVDVAAEAPAREWGLSIGVALDAPRTPLATGTSHVDAAALIAARALDTADRYVGTRYRWAGDSPARGFDCSGFVRYVFGQQGITLPRISRDQARAGRAIPTSLEGLAPGDLLFFAQRGPAIDHVAIYAGDGRIVHASRSGYGVRYDELTGDRGRWYAQHLVAVRRVIDGDVVIEDGMRAAESDVHETPLDGALESERGDAAAPAPEAR